MLKGDRGYFNARLNNLRVTKRKLDKRNHNVTNESLLHGSAAELNETEIELSDEESKEILLFLKSLIVSNENMDMLLAKLDATRSYRSKLMIQMELNLKEEFPYFFTNPELVDIKTFQIHTTILYSQIKIIYVNLFHFIERFYVNLI